MPISLSGSPEKRNQPVLALEMLPTQPGVLLKARLCAAERLSRQSSVALPATKHGHTAINTSSSMAVLPPAYSPVNQHAPVCRTHARAPLLSTALRPHFSHMLPLSFTGFKCQTEKLHRFLGVKEQVSDSVSSLPRAGKNKKLVFHPLRLRTLRDEQE